MTRHPTQPAEGAAGIAVRALRTERELTLDQLAEQIGSTKSILSKIERGTATPNVRTLERIAAALDVVLVIEFRPRHSNPKKSRVKVVVADA